MLKVTFKIYSSVRSYKDVLRHFKIYSGNNWYLILGYQASLAIVAHLFHKCYFPYIELSLGFFNTG